jgi:hypothetical protein
MVRRWPNVCPNSVKVTLPEGRLSRMSGYDVVGDIHGCGDMLEGLLGELEYAEQDGTCRYSGTGEERLAVFVGDLVDRGDQQVKTLEIVRAMVEAGNARVVMGNHEFNAVSFATPNPEIPGEFMRPHSNKNLRQHKAFTDQISPGTHLYDQWIEWFRTLPLWLDLDGIRIVHACWNREAIELVNRWVAPGSPMSTEFVVRVVLPGCEVRRLR